MGVYQNLIDNQSIPEQFKDAVNFNKLLSIFGAEVDELIIASNQVALVLSLVDAIGAQLDLIGRLVVQGRNGLNDDDYRQAIQLKIFENTSRAFVEDIIYIVKTVTASTKVIYTDGITAAYTIYFNGETIMSGLKDFIDRITGGGISVDVYASDGETNYPLVFDIAPTIQSNLIDNLDNQFVTNDGLNIVLQYSDDNAFTGDLMQLYNGLGLGVVATNNLTDNLGNNIVTDAGDQLVAVDNEADPTDGGKLVIAL